MANDVRSKSGSGALCVGPRRSLCQGPTLSVGARRSLCRGPALSLRLPDALVGVCVGIRDPVLTLCVSGARRSSPNPLCVRPGCLCLGVGPQRSSPASLSRAPTPSVGAVSGRGGRLCVGARALLLTFSVSVSGYHGPGSGDLVSGPGALCVRARQSVSGPGALSVGPRLSLTRGAALSVSGAVGALCVRP